MSIVERADEALATSTGQTAGWVVILAVVLGVFSQSGSDSTFLVIVVALGMSWILGASHGRHQGDDADQDEEGESLSRQ